MVGFLTESSQQAGWMPAIISRGYRNRSQAKIQRVRFCENSNLDEPDTDGQNQLLKIVKDITSKGFVRNNYKKNLVDLSDVKINLKGKK